MHLIEAINDRINTAIIYPGDGVFIQTGKAFDDWGIEQMIGFEANVTLVNFLRGSVTVQRADGSQKVVPGHQIIKPAGLAPRA